MTTQSTINLFKALVAINNDRINGFHAAAKATEEPELNILFDQFADTSAMCKHELIEETSKLQGKVCHDHSATCHFFGEWQPKKRTENTSERQSILQHCLQGDSEVLDEYKQKIVQNIDQLSAAHQALLQKQYSEIRDNYMRIKLMLTKESAED